jgi:hypothetical protein
VTQAMILLIGTMVILELILLVIAVVDLVKPERRVRGGSKPLWALVIVFVGVFGPIIYFLAGREDE